ncbi:hypothetical protein ACLOJK_014313 [Asimina triloba]
MGEKKGTAGGANAVGGRAGKQASDDITPYEAGVSDNLQPNMFSLYSTSMSSDGYHLNLKSPVICNGRNLMDGADGISLCRITATEIRLCHYNFRDKYGWDRNRRIQMLGFFSSKVDGHGA